MSQGLELALLVIALIAIVLLAGDLLRSGSRQRRERRHLERLRGEEEADEQADDQPPQAEPGRLRRRLLGAGLRLPPAVFVAATILLGLLVLFGMLRLFPTLPLAAVLSAALAVYIPYLALREWGQFRGRRFEVKLVDAVDYMASALQAGENATQALASAAEASDGAVRRELTALLRRLEAGAPISRAVQPLRLGYDSEGARLFTQTLTVKWQAGGDLAPVLRSIAWIMRERVRITLRLRSELAGVQLAAIIMAIVPYLLIPFFLARQPAYSQLMMQHPLGPPLLVGAILLQALGLVTLRRVLRIEI